MDTATGGSENEDDHEVLRGAQLSAKVDFSTKKSGQIQLTPIIVDFRRLLQCKSSVDIIPGVPNRELLHAVVGLYDVSLCEMTPDVLYCSVCEKWARTIILLKDAKDVLEDVKSKRSKKQPVNQETQNTNSLSCLSQVSEDSLEVEKQYLTTDTNARRDESQNSIIDKEKDIYEADEDKPSMFANVYSDTEEEDDEDSDEEEEEDFSAGVHTFLGNVHGRKKACTDLEELSIKDVGIEQRLVAAMTFEKTYCKTTERVIHLTLIAVRKRYRKMGFGRYLLNHVKDTAIVGPYDAVVVHADNSAVEFFERYGFSNDVVLNSKWSELAEQFTNCTLMSFMPPFTTQTITKASVPELDIIAMEKEVQKWREKSIEAYRAEVSCMNRMRQEIIHLRALTSSQQQLIATLAADSEMIRKDKFTLQKQYLELKLAIAKTGLDICISDEDSGEDIDTEQLLKDLKLQAKESENRRYKIQKEEISEEPYNHLKDSEEFFKVTQNFYEGLKHENVLTNSYDVKMINKAMLCGDFFEKYKMKLKITQDPHMTTNLYYCGGLEHPDRLDVILKQGFSEKDFSHGEYGRGLYFSKYPSKALQFSEIGKILLVEVGLGNTKTEVKQDRARTSVDDCFDSIITPGRLSSSGDNDGLICQEYVVFDIYQACPLYLVEYTIHED